MSDVVKHIVESRRAHQFYTPEKLEGNTTTPLNKYDDLLSHMFKVVEGISHATEAVRKNKPDVYHAGLISAMQVVRDAPADLTTVGPELNQPMTEISALRGKMMLVITELVEAVEEAEAGNIEHFHEEMADVQIRLNDIYGSLNIPIDQAVAEKMDKNDLRPPKHGKRTNL